MFLSVIIRNRSRRTRVNPFRILISGKTDNHPIPCFRAWTPLTIPTIAFSVTAKISMKDSSMEDLGLLVKALQNERMSPIMRTRIPSIFLSPSKVQKSEDMYDAISEKLPNISRTHARLMAKSAVLSYCGIKK
jgi:hypothetical protein